jgi:hypothetical protein
MPDRDQAAGRQALAEPLAGLFGPKPEFLPGVGSDPPAGRPAAG